jgi:hypothetical protein
MPLYGSCATFDWATEGGPMINTRTERGRVVRVAVLVAALASLVSGVSAAQASPQRRLTIAGLDRRATAYAEFSSPTVFTLASRLPVLSQAGGASLGGIQWTERTYATGTGEAVEVSVSPSYPDDEAIGQRWADFFASLVHGPELLLLNVYVASLPEVHAICGGSAVGCYGDQQLILTNEPAFGFSPEEVARHEYGHHIALNRSNTPWRSFDWGPKRWATAARICERVRWNDAYPGDESLLYKLNPGEAFAEAYRVLVDIRLGEAHPAWPLVDPGFYPDQAALDAIEQDIVSPWIGPTVHNFHPRGRAWVHRVATPLDGTLTVRLAGPAQLALTGDDGQAMRPTRRRATTVSYQVCGQRSVTIRVPTPDKVARRVSLEVVTP